MTDTPSISNTIRRITDIGASIIWIAETLRADGFTIDPKTLTKLRNDSSGGLTPSLLSQLHLALERRWPYFQEYASTAPSMQIAYAHAQQHALPDTNVSYTDYLAFITPLLHKDTAWLSTPSLLHNLDPNLVDLSTASSDTRRITLKFISGLLRNVTNTRHADEARAFITEHATRNGQQAEPLLTLLQNSLPLTRSDQLHTIRQLHRDAHSIYSQHRYTIPQVTSERAMLTDSLRALRGLELIFIGGRYKDTLPNANAGTYIVNFINVVQTTNPALFHAARLETNDDPERIHNNIVRQLTSAMTSAMPSPQISAPTESPQPEQARPQALPAAETAPAGAGETSEPDAPKLDAPEPDITPTNTSPDATPDQQLSTSPADNQPVHQPDVTPPAAAPSDLTPPDAATNQGRAASPAGQPGLKPGKKKVGHRDNLLMYLNANKHRGDNAPTPASAPTPATQSASTAQPARPAQSDYLNNLPRSTSTSTPAASTPETFIPERPAAPVPPRPAPPEPRAVNTPVTPTPLRRRAGSRSPMNMHDAFRMIHTTDEQTLDYVRSFMPQQLLASPDILHAVETDDTDSPAGQAILAANEARARREQRMTTLKVLEEQFAPALLIIKHAATPYPSRNMAAAFTDVDRLTELPSLDLNTLTAAWRRTIMALLGVQGPDVNPTPEYLANALLHPRTSSVVRTARKIYELLRSVHQELHLMMSRGASESQMKLSVLDLLTPDLHAAAALAFNLHPNVFTTVTHGQMTTLLTVTRWVHTQQRLTYALRLSDGTETLETLAIKLLPDAPISVRQALCDAVTGPGVPAVMPTSQVITKLECDIARVALNDAGLTVPGLNGTPDQKVSTELEKYALVTHAQHLLHA